MIDFYVSYIIPWFLLFGASYSFLVSWKAYRDEYVWPFSYAPRALRFSLLLVGCLSLVTVLPYAIRAGSGAETYNLIEFAKQNSTVLYDAWVVLAFGLCFFFAILITIDFILVKRGYIKDPPPVPPAKSLEQLVNSFRDNLYVHDFFKNDIVQAYTRWQANNMPTKKERMNPNPDHSPVNLAYFVRSLPFVAERPEFLTKGDVSIIPPGHDVSVLPPALRVELAKITYGTAIPEAMRVEHHQIVANPGHGKSTLITQMFFEDLKKDCAIVLIDSQGDLINDLATRVPADRLIVVDPETCPPALNMFATKIQGEQGINNALSLFEYIFGSLGVALTGQQEMVYRYLSRLCMMIPGGSINTLRDMLQPGGTEQYLPYIQQMNENAQAFFRSFEQEKNNAFKETRQAVLNRLLKVLESDTFASMLGAERMALDIPKALSEGKVILVSTAKNFLGGGASLLGRIFVAQVMQAVRNRQPGDRKRVYLYIDEFADYAEDSDILLDCFTQGRKYELGMIVAHQNLEQLTPKLAATISSSTAIKFAGGVSAEDARRLGSQMRVDYREIDRQPKGTFLAYFKDIGTIPWPVKFGYINTVPIVNNIYEIHEKMRELYGPTEKKRPTPPPERPRDDTGEDAW